MNDFPFAIIGFDLDGTLVDTSRDLLAAANHALGVAGRPPLALDPMTLGLVYLVFLPSLLTTPFAGAAAKRFGVRPTVAFGLLVALAGLPLLLSGAFLAVLAGLAAIGCGTFFAQAAATGFIGRAATQGSLKKPLRWKCIYLEVDVNDADCVGGEAVLHNGRCVGSISTASYGHRVKKSLAFAYVAPDHARAGEDFDIMVLGEERRARSLGEPAFDPRNERMRADG